MKRVAIVGTGRLGTSLGRALARAGFAVAVLADADLAAARRARRLVGRGVATTDLGRAGREAELIVVSVPDGEVRSVARTLAAALPDWRGKMVVHTSGLLPASALSPLKARGARVASFHPAQSFPRPTMPPVHFRGISYAVEGDPAAVREARILARRLGGRAFEIKARDKALYHAACAVASNLLVPLFDLACEALVRAGIPPAQARKTLLPLAEGTLRNVKELDTAGALTGPLARADVEAVGRHLEALGRSSAAGEAYAILGRRALAILRRRGVPAAEILRLKARLERK